MKSPLEKKHTISAPIVGWELIIKIRGFIFQGENFGHRSFRTHTGLESYLEGVEKEEIFGSLKDFVVARILISLSEGSVRSRRCS